MNPPELSSDSTNPQSWLRFLSLEALWQYFIYRGYRRHAELTVALRPDSRDARHFGSYHKHYHVAHTSIIHPDPDLPDLVDPFVQLGINPKAVLLKNELLTSFTADILNETAASAPDGVLIAITSFSVYDTNPPGPQRLPWSDLAWQQWVGAAGSYERLRRLRYIVRRAVFNVYTKKVIAIAYRKLGLDPSICQEFTFDRGGEKSMDDAFLALLGTDNGNSTAHLLIDHAGALGRKRIDKILTWADRKDPLMIFVLSNSLYP